MKKALLCLLIAGSLAGCNSSRQSDRALAGGLIGAGGGALVGGLATGTGGGALAGAAIGGAGGAIIGASTTPRRYGGCYARDDYGQRYRVSC